MNRNRAAFIVTLGIAAAATVGYGYSHRDTASAPSLSVARQASAAEQPILYYRDPTGAPFWSAMT